MGSDALTGNVREESTDATCLEATFPIIHSEDMVVRTQAMLGGGGGHVTSLFSAALVAEKWCKEQVNGVTAKYSLERTSQ